MCISVNLCWYIICQSLLVLCQSLLVLCQYYANLCWYYANLCWYYADIMAGIIIMPIWLLGAAYCTVLVFISLTVECCWTSCFSMSQYLGKRKRPPITLAVKMRSLVTQGYTDHQSLWPRRLVDLLLANIPCWRKCVYYFSERIEGGPDVW